MPAVTRDISPMMPTTTHGTGIVCCYRHRVVAVLLLDYLPRQYLLTHEFSENWVWLIRRPDAALFINIYNAFYLSNYIFIYQRYVDVHSLAQRPIHGYLR